MCVVSMVMDYYQDKWERQYIYPTQPTFPTFPSKEEIKEFRELLERAREYDRKTGQPNCELEEKKDAIKKLADNLGIEISFL